MSKPFDHTVLSVVPAPPGFRVDVHHYETPPGGKATTAEQHKFPLVAWAVVRRDDWSESRECTDIEPVFLWRGVPMVASNYRRSFSDIHPDPGKPKLTVGIYVSEPAGYVAL
ncbi:hypothetical protein [Streptomyces flavochromogenes]|uniref:hypothetical protein n=1 Tax=Streptomyces flavochromogenes TaxID=68199 RepID=UPI0004C22B18|nr:hypothetical protein [Streptomyces flavochromogenes]